MKKNLLKIPNQVLSKLHTIELDDIIVACVKRLSRDDISKYTHLGLKVENDQLVIPPPAIPKASIGRYSKANVEGKEVVRKDLPMVTRTYSWQTPNWGDWSKGSHTHDQTREVYQRDFIRPKEVELSIALLEKRDDAEFIIKFAIEQVLSKRAPDFEDELLYNLNILQENVGAADVFPSAATLADYTKTVRVDWEILPPGKVDEVIKRMLQGKRAVAQEQQRTMEKRLQVMARHKPEAYIAGTNGFLRYFGAMFEDNLVVFENLTYGNALYVMYEKWETLSKKSRIELLKGPRDGFDRIEHRKGWEHQLGAIIRNHRKTR
jgi:hypothetical protein